MTTRISIVVPSYRRPARLRECLDSLSRSETQPDEVIVALRPEDLGGREVVEQEERLNAFVAWTTVPGVLAAMGIGASRATGDIIAFIDDDAAPAPDWIDRILTTFADPGVGAVGGRDIVTDPDTLDRTESAGLITAWGKMIGDHHRSVGFPRDVDVLKAANMAFRAEALALPSGLLGEGAQVHFEVATCLWAQKAGWRLVLDPAAEVLHLPGDRFDEDSRRGPSPTATRRAAYNYTICLLTLRPHLRRRRLAYGLIVGDRGMPGLVRASAALLKRDLRIARRLGPSLRGQIQGARAARRHPIRMLPVRSPSTPAEWVSQ